MMGDSAVVNETNDRIPGLYLLALEDLFKGLENHNKKITLWLSFYEIYCGKLYDLLNDRK